MMKSLTKAEEAVMQTLWKLQQGFLKDIVEGAGAKDDAARLMYGGSR